MGKSIRSKRKKRLRSLRREKVEEHYQKKQDERDAASAAALEAPPAEIVCSLDTTPDVGMELGRQRRLLPPPASTDATMDERGGGGNLKAKGGVNKTRSGKKARSINKNVERKLRKQAEFPV
eukprot:TRINITY_DN353_c0_g1_i1.p1 TRINITY_DN353_c0_g1~~TRINITY_DN353_c0_g1_i1.p1  ORF type:complete len:122 (+),score=31.50 TRINITY_DN353_c0_g1_i1:169-534(+)